MSESILKLPEGFFPSERYTISGRHVGGKNVYWCERNRPRDMIRVEFVKDLKIPEDFDAYFQEALDRRK